MHRNQPVPRRHIVEQGTFLRFGNTVPVGIDQQPVEPVQVGRVEVFEPVGVGEIDAFVAQRGHQFGHPFNGLVMPLVAQK